MQDVNSFVAKADSAKQQHACLLQLSSLQENLLLDDFSLKPPHQTRDFMSSSESTNDDSEDDYSDNNSDIDLRWNALMSSYGVPAMHSASSAAGATMASASTVTNNNNNNTHANEKLMIKIKKPRHGIPSPMNSALPSPYGEHPWDLVSPKTSKSAGYGKSNSKYRKSMSNIYSAAATSGKKKAGKFDPKGRRGSAPHRLTIHNNTSASSMGSLHSSSSLSSLSSNLQRSMRVSESIHSLLSDEDEADQEPEEEHEMLLEEEEEDDDDDEYQIRAPNAPSHGQLPTKKGRNVDKACNHCKRSHLRCDDMRPCRRCVATGKQGCKDVQHKPRGRPKLHKKLTK